MKHLSNKTTPLLFSLVVLTILFLTYQKQTYAAGNIYGACAGLQQTQAVCTDDPCGTGVATNYPNMQYNGYLPGNGGACSQYCCVNTPVNTSTPIPSHTPVPSHTLTPSPSVTTTPVPSVTVSVSPSVTLTPSVTPATIAVTVCPHGLGNCGDNVSPGIGGNKNPKHLERAASINVFNNNDQIVASLPATLHYSSASANFSATVNVPSTVPTGQYLIKISSNGYLTKQIPGIVQLTSGQTTTIPVVSLVTGNINNDEQLDILDYNLLTNCFGAKQTTASCTTPPTTTTSGSDINDDGIVDASDYNLLLREFSVQKGN